MIIKPLIRRNICINAHPEGCAKDVERQIKYVQDKRKKRGAPKDAPKTVLVLGCSTGYGLASRISAAFGFNATTVGVSFEKEGTETKSGTPGWYNNMAFDKEAKAAGIKSITFNGDAFSDAMRKQIADTAKELGVKFDLVIYSLASGVRVDPDTGVLYRSVLKPLGDKAFSGKTIEMTTNKLEAVSLEPASAEETASTVKVMGGEDWKRWIKQLTDMDVLAQGCKTIAYSYIGPALSHAIYRDGTIGAAKKHLENTANELSPFLKQKLGGDAFVSENKGLVTRSSAVIPIIPLYLSVLFKVMKKNGTHEGCIEQMERLFNERLYTGAAIPVDANRLIRIDDWEMDPKVQSEVIKILESVTEENLSQVADLKTFRHDFLATNGFDVEGVDYSKDVARMDTI